MNFQVLTDIPWCSCLSPWQLHHKQPLIQLERIQTFINHHAIEDVSYVSDDVNLLMHDMHVFTINHALCSLQVATDKIQNVVDHSRKFAWISINKFLIYNENPQSYHFDDQTWDAKLVNHIASQLSNCQVLHTHIRDDDRGTIGNFQYPVTALVLETR